MRHSLTYTVSEAQPDLCVVPLLLATAGGKGFDAKGTTCQCTEFNGRGVPSEGVAQLVLPQHGMSLWWQHALFIPFPTGNLIVVQLASWLLCRAASLALAEIHGVHKTLLIRDGDTLACSDQSVLCSQTCTIWYAPIPRFSG